MLKVLIVEDDLMLADFAEELLVEHGYTVSGIARTVGDAVAGGDGEDRTGLATSKVATMKITPPPPSCTHFQTTSLPCLTCGRPMKLTLIEPSGPCIELRTFECAACDTGASFLMAI
jgi:hypothetical protein